MIELKEAVLIRFGKFKNTSLKFGDGLQVFYGGNEAGKSTVQNFIKIMLYDVPGRKKAGEFIKERDRIIPHGEKTAEGILRILIDGREIEIRKRIGKTAAMDKSEVLDANTGEVIEEYPTENIGETIFGVTQNVFEKTFWLCQNGVLFSGKDDEIAKHLINLQSTGDEEVSAEKTLVELEKIYRSVKARNKSQNRGRIDILLKQREEKIQERFRLMEQAKQRIAQQRRLAAEKERLAMAEKTEEKLNLLLDKQEKLRMLDTRLKKWQQIEKLSGLRDKITNDSEYIKYKELTDDEVSLAEFLEEKIKILDRNDNIEYDKNSINKNIKIKGDKQKKFKGLTFGGGASVILALVFAALRIPFWEILSSVFMGIGLIGLIPCGIILKKIKAETEQLTEKLSVIESEERNAKAEREKVEADLNKVLALYGCSSAGDLKKARNLCIKTETEAKGIEDAYNSLTEGEDIKALMNEAKDAEAIIADSGDVFKRDIKGELKKVGNTRNEAAGIISDIEGKLAYVFNGGGDPAYCESEILSIDAEISELEKKLKAVEMAAEVFSSVYEKKRSVFAPRVNEKVNEILDILTMGRYNETRVSEEYRLRLKNSVEAEYLSRGTYEQVYFALRLALAELIGKGDEPLFLDDFMTSYDDRRSEAAMEILKKISEKRQILLFTCHGRDAHKAEEMGVAVNYLEEETENGC